MAHLINNLRRMIQSKLTEIEGLECGITIENFNDIKEKDVIEAYELVEIKR